MKAFIFAVVCTFFLGGAAFGDDHLTSLRCSAGLITVGANKVEVISKCGQPVSKDFVQLPSKRSRHDVLELEEWTYNFGPNDFIHTMRFDGATLLEIRRGARGY